MTTKKPPEQEVGARVRVKAEYADAAADRFSRDGLLPVFVEHRTDGAVSFWFGNLNDADLLRAANAIPRDWYAVSGVVR